MNQESSNDVIDPSFQTQRDYNPPLLTDIQHPHHANLDPALTAADNHASPEQNVENGEQQEQHEHEHEHHQHDDPGTLGTPQHAGDLQDLGQPDQASFADLEELITHLQGFAKDHGFALVRSTLRRREVDKAPILLNLLCDRHGHLRNHRGLTEETRVRKKRKSRGIGCPYRISCTLRQNPNKKKAAQRTPAKVKTQAPVTPSYHDQQVQPDLQSYTNDMPTPMEGLSVAAYMTPYVTPQDGYQQQQQQTPVVPPQAQMTDPALGGEEPEMWTFKVTSISHNHGPEFEDGETHWKHRRISNTDMKRIRQWFIDGKSPREMLDAIKEDAPDCLYQLKDVQNARRKAKTQFEDYLEGKLPGQ